LILTQVEQYFSVVQEEPTSSVYRILLLMVIRIWTKPPHLLTHLVYGAEFLLMSFSLFAKPLYLVAAIRFI